LGLSRIFWDTNLFIYLFEDNGELSERVAQLRSQMLKRNDELLTSTFTLGEILVKPIENGFHSLRKQYEDVLQSISTLVPLDVETAAIYASIRQDRKIRSPDAIQLACAARARTDLFITNDGHLQGKVIPGIHFIVPLANALI
jgi:predicted nucleic acid-binding protein